MPVEIMHVNPLFEKMGFWREFLSAIDSMPGGDLRSAAEALVDREDIAAESGLLTRLLEMLGTVPGFNAGGSSPVVLSEASDLFIAGQMIGEAGVLHWSFVEGVDGHLVAHWDEDSECYVVPGKRWLSQDTRTWMTYAGKPVSSKELDESWIWLVSGPLDGITLS